MRCQWRTTGPGLEDGGWRALVLVGLGEDLVGDLNFDFGGMADKHHRTGHTEVCESAKLNA